MIECIDLDNFALTGNVSRYSEDSLTAQQLLIKTARRTKETVALLKSMVDGLKNFTSVEYNTPLEELVLKTVEYSQTNYITKHYFLFNENSKGFIELAGDISKVINNALECYPEIISIIKDLQAIKDVDGVQAKLTELETHVDSCFSPIYDECSYTTLELAGHTANKLNEFIITVNMVEEIVILFNSTPVTYDSTEEMLEVLGTLSGDTLEI